jgi:hypothetical protein
VDQVVLSTAQWAWVGEGGFSEMGSIWNPYCKCFCSLYHGSIVYYEESGMVFLLSQPNLVSPPACMCFNFPLLLACAKQVHTKTCDTISTGIQLGFLGCLSTVSTFIAEYNAMEESQKNWRAYAYALMTIAVSFGLGILIYSVPVWTRGYK